MNDDILDLFKRPKQTPVKAYIKPSNSFMVWYKTLLNRKIRRFNKGCVIFGDYDEVNKYIKECSSYIKDFEIEFTCRNSAIPLLNILDVDARIEPGAIIREGVTIHNHCVILMGAIINIGAEIGEETMIDMGAVIGARAFIGKKCHIGANAVIAGVLEPPSNSPCVIEDHVLIGANAVILEGVRIGENSVIGAGSIVLENVPCNSVVVGNPGKIIKVKDDKTNSKTQIVEVLRNM